MEKIHPICNENVMPYVGRQVCAVTHDGSHYYGTICRVEGDQLVLNGYIGRPGELNTLGLKSKSSGQKGKKANTSAFFPGYGYGYGYGFNDFFLPFASLALLFALPFFFFF